MLLILYHFGTCLSNNNQLITYYLHVRYLLRIQQYPVNNTYNKGTPLMQQKEKANI